MCFVQGELLQLWCWASYFSSGVGRATSALVLGELLQLWCWVSYFSSGVGRATSALVLGELLQLCVLTWTALRAVRILPVLGAGASTGFYLKSCQMFCLPLRRRSPSLPLSRAELLSYCCPILEVRWVGQLLALCLAFLLPGLAALAGPSC